MEPLITSESLSELIRAEVENYRDKANQLEALIGIETAKPVISVPRMRAGKSGNGRTPMSTKLRAMRRQQGRYMGVVRQLGARDKARVSKIREKFGYVRAIKLATRLAR